MDNATISPATLMNSASSPNRLVFKTPPLPGAGPDQRHADDRAGRSPSSKPKANMTAHLISYPGGAGNGTVISRGWIDPENRDSPALTEAVMPGVTYELEFDMQPKDSVIAAGRRLGVMIISSDRDYTIRPAPGSAADPRPEGELGHDPDRRRRARRSRTGAVRLERVPRDLRGRSGAERRARGRGRQDVVQPREATRASASSRPARRRRGRSTARRRQRSARSRPRRRPTGTA